MDTYPYFIIRFLEAEKEIEKLTEVDTLIPEMIEIQKRGARLLTIIDHTKTVYTPEEMFETFKEGIQIQYEDISSKQEAYQMALDYFNGLKNKNVWYEQDYNRHIKLLEKYQKSEKEVSNFIEKIIQLYLS